MPGFRYLYTDGGGAGTARASPRAKVSAMSHHARALAASLRDSLGPLPGGAAALAPAGGGGVGSGSGEGGASSGSDGNGSSEQAAASEAAAAADLHVLEALANSSQDVWAAAWRPGGGRQLLAVRERRSERELAEAGDVLSAFAAAHFFL